MARSAFTVEHLQRWAERMDEVHRRIAPRFARVEARERSRRYLEGLLKPVKRKNGWQLAEEAGELTPDGMQRLLSAAKWDADEVRDDLREYVLEHLGEPGAILVVDETGFLKKGTKSVGVKRQYCGTAGRIENCQIGVFLAYASGRGRAFIDRALYLPREWAEDEQRRAEAGVPEEIEFATKPQLARQMLERALAAGLQAAWVTADENYGRDGKFRRWLEEQGQAYVLAVGANQFITSPEAGVAPNRRRVDAVAAEAPEGAWRRLSVGEGAKGPRLYDWARVRLPLPRAPEGWGRWLLVRRSIQDPDELAYYLAAGPEETPLEELARVAGGRWIIEECFEEAKGEVGLDEYEVRRWDSWHRYITLALLAHAFLAVVRAVVQEEAEPKKGDPNGAN